MTIKCLFCDEHVEQYDVTAGGADSQGSRGAAGTFDYPASIACELCGAEYCDGDVIALPDYLHTERLRELLLHPTVLAALSKLVEHVDD